ncbi:MAG: TrkA family potassium uptake protein [Candidatus Limivivens sp.]|nr:TrkA family potassium uptake protein [Candidatus Limivivens sp.]
MAAKSFVVFGLGQFGSSVAVALAKNGCEVLAVDIDGERVEDIAGAVTYAVKGDVTDPDIYESLGLRNMDGAIIAITKSMEASIMATILSKEAGIPYVMSKASSDTHATVLRKLGADRIIFPEKEMGYRVARNMVFGKFVDTFELSDRFSMVEMAVPESWAGKSIRALDIRRNWGVNIIAVKQGENVNVSLEPDDILRSDQVLLIVGDNAKLKKIR